jgi:hypothetical protein
MFNGVFGASVNALLHVDRMPHWLDLQDGDTSLCAVAMQRSPFLLLPD